MIIKVLGLDCAKCREAEQLVRTAVQESGSTASVEKVSDLKEMMTLGVMSPPAVVIDGTIMCTGRIPTRAEIMDWIAAPGATEGTGATGPATSAAPAGGCSCGGKC